MTDNLSPEDRRKTMQAVKGRATALERRLAGMLIRMGLRGWRKNANDILGNPDIVFDDQKVAIFLDGCFWHGCPHCKRKLPATNHDYWERKILRNIERARATNVGLTKEGWRVVRIWEHETRGDSSSPNIRQRILAALNDEET